MSRGQVLLWPRLQAAGLGGYRVGGGTVQEFHLTRGSERSSCQELLGIQNPVPKPWKPICPQCLRETIQFPEISLQYIPVTEGNTPSVPLTGSDRQTPLAPQT